MYLVNTEDGKLMVTGGFIVKFLDQSQDTKCSTDECVDINALICIKQFILLPSQDIWK